MRYAKPNTVRVNGAGCRNVELPVAEHGVVQENANLPTKRLSLAFVDGHRERDPHGELTPLPLERVVSVLRRERYARDHDLPQLRAARTIIHLVFRDEHVPNLPLHGHSRPVAELRGGVKVSEEHDGHALLQP